MRSLRFRAVFAGVIWAILSTLVGLFGLGSFLDAFTLAHFDEMLSDRHTQVVIAVANSSGRPYEIPQYIFDPAYARPFSGDYFQIESGTGVPVVSPSLADQLLPQLEVTSSDPLFVNFIGPSGEAVRGINQMVSLEDGSKWHVRVASSVGRLEEDRQALRENILLAIGFIGVVGVLGAILQVSATLRPINTLRKDLLSRWENDGKFETDAYPKEVAPLVNDINLLLDRNREVLSRSRRQAADLAHAIKTPAAIVRNELEVLQQEGHDLRNSIDAINQLDAHLKRSLARMRADGAGSNGQVFTDLDLSLGRMTRAFSAMASHEDKVLSTKLMTGLRVRVDQADFEEIIGNLLDNALKWSTSRVLLASFVNKSQVTISIEDDGPGIREKDYDLATRSGQRLDTSQPGTGLGLAITSDLLQAYGGTLVLKKSKTLGGLQARVVIPLFGI